MYQVGDMVVYGSMGVCRIDAIRTDEAANDESALHYFLKPLHHSCLISTPVDNTSVRMRRVISRDEAERLIDSIPSIDPTAYQDSSPQQVAAHYAACLKSQDCADLIQLTMSIYAKKQDVEEHNRKLSAADARVMKQAEELLFGELAVALDMPREDVQSYIESRVVPT